MTTTTLPSPRPVVLGALAWLLAAIAVGATGFVAGLRPPGAQIIIFVLTSAAIFASVRIDSVRRAVDAIPLRGLVAIHVLRFVGIAFLILGSRGLMSSLFAERAGWGDVITAAGALLLATIGLGGSALKRQLFMAWNVFGTIDLFLAVGTATLVTLRGDAPGMQLIVQLPLILVPIFAVPVLFASHVALFRRVGELRR